MTDETRDIAVESRAMIQQHMLDCKQFREGLREDMKEFRTEFKKLNYRIAMLLGGLVLLSRAAEFIFTVWKH